MGVISSVSKTAADNQTFESRGDKRFTQAYASTSAPVLKKAKMQEVYYAELTGAMTINADVSNLEQGDLVIFHFTSDGTGRTVTYGTGLSAVSTQAVTASKDANATFVFDGTNLREISRSQLA